MAEKSKEARVQQTNILNTQRSLKYTFIQEHSQEHSQYLSTPNLWRTTVFP